MRRRKTNFYIGVLRHGDLYIRVLRFTHRYRITDRKAPHTEREREREAMEVELKEMLHDLESLKQSLPDPSHRASIDKVFFQIHSYSYVCMYVCMYMSLDHC